MTSQEVDVLQVGSIFGDAKYEVPIYQRAYAWGADEISTLLRDIQDRARASLHAGASDYYLGTLVTYERRDPESDQVTLEVVDGQQRLTTLFILLALIGLQPRQLSYEGRPTSDHDLDRIARQGSEVDPATLEDSRIAQAVQIIQRALSDTGHDGLRLSQPDIDYLITRVKVLRTSLPRHTDLNHYFEVMNSRGEQLEKHEIVRAHLIGLLTPSPEGRNFGDCCERNTSDTEGRENSRAVETFDRIWSACADMSRHVQLGFDTTARVNLFGSDWCTVPSREFAEVNAQLAPSSERWRGPVTLADALAGNGTVAEADNGAPADEAERYGSIIDFPNLVLHALALTVDHKARTEGESTVTRLWAEETPIPLDDKQLVSLFHQHLQCRCSAERFATHLLRLRFLFDTYVIKTDQTRESEDNSNWVLHVARRREGTQALTMRATFDDGGVTQTSGDQKSRRIAHERVVMVQSMYQVTDSRRAYKVFLFHLLRYLDSQAGAVNPESLADFLEDLASQRYQVLRMTPKGVDRGQSTPHFVFNLLDYVLWKRYGFEGATGGPHYVRSFRFRYRKSVEHFFPQSISAESGLEEPTNVDAFGNLCLMTASENSRRSNLAPGAKVQEYRSENESLKFQLMASATKRHIEAGDTSPAVGPWNETDIEEHEHEMLALLEDFTS